MESNSATIIPLFPLNITVLPDESIALHIFEPRYRQLIEDCRDGKEFGIVYLNEKVISSFGTKVHIDQIVNEFPDGSCDIIVKGDHVFELKRLIANYDAKMYSSAEIELKAIETTNSEELNVLFRKYLDQTGKVIHDNENTNIFNIANRIELSHENKNHLISLPNSQSMIKFLQNQIRFLLKIRYQEDILDKNFYLN